MFQINQHYTELQGSYLFSRIASKVRAYEAEHPEEEIIRLGIGDVTLPLAPAVIKALHAAVDEMAVKETFRGYAPDLGYEFLRAAIRDHDYKSRGADIEIDEIFISDGAKSDCGNIGDIFSLRSGLSSVPGFERDGRQSRKLPAGDREILQYSVYALHGGERLYPSDSL